MGAVFPMTCARLENWLTQKKLDISTVIDQKFIEIENLQKVQIEVTDIKQIPNQA